METVTVTDTDGESYTVHRYDGRLFPNFSKGDLKSRVDAFKNLHVRDDDVFIASYPKAGKHWVYEITNMLLTGEMEYMTSYATTGSTGERNVEEMKSPRILASHFLFKDFPVELPTKQCRVIYVTRNMKDCAVSYYNHLIKMESCAGYNGTFKGFLPLFIRGQVAYGSWFDHTKQWEAAINDHQHLTVLHLQYEEMKKDLLTHVKKIAEFLGVDKNDELFEKIAERCDFQNMKDSSSFGNPWKSLTKDGKSPICRKGVVGDWKNWFTVAQNEMFDEMYNKEMKDSKFKFHQA